MFSFPRFCAVPWDLLLRVKPIEAPGVFTTTRRGSQSQEGDSGAMAAASLNGHGLMVLHHLANQSWSLDARILTQVLPSLKF